MSISLDLQTESSLASILSSNLPPSDSPNTNNYDLNYGLHKSRVLCIVIIVASIVSILSAIVFHCFFFKIRFNEDPLIRKKLVFRHNLLFSLISINLVKTVLCLIYPIFSLSDDYYLISYKTLPCSVIGYFVYTFVTMCDYINLIFTIHIGLLFFKPNWTKYYPKNSHYSVSHEVNRILVFFQLRKQAAPAPKMMVLEGGLYKWRHPLMAAILIIPWIQTAFAFLNKHGFVSYGSFCYLPADIWWPRLLSNWVAKCLIMFVMIVVYISIYFYIAKKYRELDKLVEKRKKKATAKSESSSDTKSNHSWGGVFVTFSKFVATSMVARKDNRVDMTLNYLAKQSENIKVDHHSLSESLEDGSLEQANHDIQNLNHEITQMNLKNLQTRRKNVLNQIKMILVYPLAYFILTVMLLVAQIYRFPTTNINEPFGLLVVISICHVIDCFIILIAFLIKETPWRWLRGARTTDEEEFMISSDTTETDIFADINEEVDSPEDGSGTKDVAPGSQDRLNETERDDVEETEMDFMAFLRA